MGCRFLDKDFIPVYNPDSEQTKKFSGRRDNRLYKTKSGIIINTDLNGSANIGRKAFPEQFTTDNCDICQGLLLFGILITVCQSIQNTAPTGISTL